MAGFLLAAVGAILVAPSLVASVEVKVRSGGWSDGNLAEFYLDGVRLAVPVGRGFNLAVLAPDGSLRTSQVFDTHAGGSEALAAFVAGLPLGAPVLVAGMDEVAGNLSETGKAALASLGAASARSLTYRCSYALIAVKGRPTSLAELQLAAGRGVAEVRALYEPVGRTTTAAPSTTINQVEPRLLSLSVRSGGFTDGNLATFAINSQDLGVTVGRGLNVVVLRPEGPVKTTKIFDTCASDSDKLQAFLRELPPGTPVMIAAMDEAATNLTSGALAEIETLGARLVRQLRWRGAYALIGVKGGAALAEQVLPAGSGVASVSCTLQAAPPPPLPGALCSARSASPPVAGWFLDGQLRLDAACRYPLWEGRNAALCLQGSWAIVAGGSNTILMAIRLADVLATDAMLPIRDGASMGESTIVDVIVENGVVLYRNSQLLAPCIDVSRPYQSDCKSAIAHQIAAAPTYTGKGTRVTLFTSQYWDHAEAALETVDLDRGWAAAKVAVLVQISTWYIYCSVKQVPWCTRPDLINETKYAGLKVFTSDMNSTLEKLQHFCRPGGRAAYHGCVVGTTSWQNPPPGYESDWYVRYNSAITTAVKPVSSETLRLVDFWTLGQAMPEEEYSGHASPVVMLWNWQVMLSGMCPSSLAAPGSLARFTGPTCFAAKSTWDLCPDYRNHCHSTFRCELWECMNSVPCSLAAVQGAVQESSVQGEALKALEALGALEAGLASGEVAELAELLLP